MQKIKIIFLFIILISTNSDLFSQKKIFYKSGNIAYNPFTRCVYYKSGKVAFSSAKTTIKYSNNILMYSASYKNIYYDNGNIIYNNVNKNLYYFSGILAYDARNKVFFDEKGEKLFAFTDVNNTKKDYIFEQKNFKIKINKYSKFKFESTLRDSGFIYKTDFKTYYKLIDPDGNATMKEIFIY